MDSLSNMLVMIKNASMRLKDKVDVPYSRMNVSVLEVLKDEGFIGSYKVIKEAQSKKQIIRVNLKYTENKT
ncbi:MAG: 30S ribosomal protein S8, partial [Elusimicrobiales bacterium]